MLGLPLADILQPDILVQEVTGGQDERKSDFIEPGKKEEKVTMVTVTTVPSLTDPNTTFFKVFKELFFQHQSLKLINFERNILT